MRRDLGPGKFAELLARRQPNMPAKKLAKKAGVKLAVAKALLEQAQQERPR